MTPCPANPKIYHITHVDNLPSIIKDGGLFADAEIIRRGGPATTVGMSTIKRRRLEELRVQCHPNMMVGEFVPFYFCPRSVMLYMIYRGNHPDLAYHGGQMPVVHLEASLYRVIEWAVSQNQRWAFSLSNAGAAYTQFRSDVTNLADLNWDAIAATNWRDPAIKEGKQAEFLLHSSFPLQLVEQIGVQCEQTWRAVVAGMANAAYRPQVQIIPEWYY
jgi:hypothetical protein